MPLPNWTMSSAAHSRRTATRGTNPRTNYFKTSSRCASAIPTPQLPGSPRSRRSVPGGGDASRRLPQSFSPLDPSPAGSFTGATANSGSVLKCSRESPLCSETNNSRRRTACCEASRRTWPATRNSRRSEASRSSTARSARPRRARSCTSRAMARRKKIGSISDARRSRTSARRLVITAGAYKRRVTRPSKAPDRWACPKPALRFSRRERCRQPWCWFPAARSRRRMRRRSRCRRSMSTSTR